MPTDLKDSVLESYFQSHRDLIAAEQVGEDNVIVSFPLHFSGGHRIELNVTSLSQDHFLVTDMARVLGELAQTGYRINNTMRDKMRAIARAAQIRIERDYLVAEYSRKDLGTNLHLFAEAAKTIGDVYLVHQQRKPTAEDALHGQVRKRSPSEAIHV